MSVIADGDVVPAAFQAQESYDVDAIIPQFSARATEKEVICPV